MSNNSVAFRRTSVSGVRVRFALAFVIAMTSICTAPAESRERRLRHRPGPSPAAVRLHASDSSTRAKDIAAIVVDANSGRTLYARNENELRRPASITKVMTLYLLFEQLEKGRMRLDGAIPISARAAAQAPTKLGLRPGATISVENAIKAVVTRSANDIAVAIAETIGGSEASFSDLMTRKARALGMTRTCFANASGLPHDEQLTTAFDLALLGRAIQDHFPRYYRYFATQTFYYAGTAIRNHNHLLDRVEGMDGIKTGYTRASGFNLLTSVKRDGRHIVAVVLGGRTAASRDKIMADLIDDQITNGARNRTAAAIPAAISAEGSGEFASVQTPAARSAPAEPASERTVAAQPEQKLPFVPVSLKPGLTVDTTPVGAISLASPIDRPRPAYVAAAPRPQPTEARPAEQVAPIPRRATLDGAFLARVTAPLSSPTATPSTLNRSRALTPTADPGSADKVAAAGRARPAIGGWMIQIGATDDMSKANDLLVRARLEGRKALGSAQPFTERVQKGSETLYRARFAGLEAETAELACKTLKRSGFACFATKN